MQHRVLVDGFLKRLAAVLSLAVLSVSAPPAALADEAASAAAATTAAAQTREEYVYRIGLQAYVYGYPLVEMYRVRDQYVFNPANPRRTPLNRFLHARDLLNAGNHVVVAPNNDTLYSSAWLDLSHGPVVLDVPDTGGRYYVMQFMDFYTNNFAYVGKRTTGTSAGSYAVVGPGWAGTVPPNVKELRAPTNSVWLLGRTLVDGPDDLAAVHALQDQYVLTPLAAWHQPAAADAVPTPPPEVPRYSNTDPLTFFQLLNVALTENPPPAREQNLMALFGQVRIGPGKKLDGQDEATMRGLRRAAEEGPKRVASLPSNLPIANGWQALASHTGNFGDDYAYRAFVAKNGLAANDPEEAYNFIARQDAQGAALNGSHRYVLKFERGQVPPVHAFWSLTMYDMPKGFFIANPINRYALGDRSKSLKRGADGSLEIYVQHDSPGADKESNWLPAPDGDFELALRCYMADAAIATGRWKPPAVTPAE